MHSDTHKHLWAEGQGHWCVLWHPNFSLSILPPLCFYGKREPKTVTDLMGQGNIEEGRLE